MQLKSVFIRQRQVGKRLLTSALCLAAFTAVVALARPDGFDIEKLPKGKSVTIPRPATTLVPLASRVQLTSTDMPQSLSFRSVSAGGSVAGSIRLAIYDRYSEHVKYVDVKPGTPFLYSYKTISSITVIPEVPAGAKASGVMLQVESDKPLEIAH